MLTEKDKAERRRDFRKRYRCVQIYKGDHALMKRITEEVGISGTRLFHNALWHWARDQGLVEKGADDGQG